jgi:hypothetical protein
MRENHLFSGERGRLRAAVRLDVVRGQYDKHGFGNCITRIPAEQIIDHQWEEIGRNLRLLYHP